MNESDLIFDIQERIAGYSDSIPKEEYWYLYSDFVKGVQNQQLNPLSIIILNTNLLKKLNKEERILFEKAECFVEISIEEGFKKVSVESEIINFSKSIIEMIQMYTSVFWLSSPLIDCLMNSIFIILEKLKTISLYSSSEIDKVNHLYQLCNCRVVKLVSRALSTMSSNLLRHLLSFPANLVILTVPALLSIILPPF